MTNITDKQHTYNFPNNNTLYHNVNVGTLARTQTNLLFV